MEVVFSKKWKTLKLWLCLVAIYALYFEHFSKEAFLAENKYTVKMLQNIEEFEQNWCRIRQARIDLHSLLKRCNYNISWNGDSPNRRIAEPAGQFSRFSIQTKARNGKLKLAGGDSWRVLLRGPATVSPTVFDYGNGTYEFLFLVMDPGVYKLDITLDYSLCDGYRDPPDDWFIVGK